jgi:hypothetical protein
MVAEAVVLVTANLAVLVVTLSVLCLLLTSRRWVFPSVVVAAEVSLSTDHLTVEVVEDLVITTQAILVLVEVERVDF